MKKLILLLSVVMLQGCMWQSVDSETLYYANKFCAEKGMKVRRIYAYWTGGINLVCSPTGLHKGSTVEFSFHKYIWLQRRILTEQILLEEAGDE